MWEQMFQRLQREVFAYLRPDARDEIPNSLGEFAVAYLVVVAAAIVVLLRRYRPGSEA